MNSELVRKIIHFVYYGLALGVGVACGLFLYNTYLAPDPYRLELVRCLKSAEDSPDPSASAVCYRDYGQR